MIKYKFNLLVSPVARICIAASILIGHILAGLVLFFLQDSVTTRNAEKILLSEIAGVQRSISVANSVNEPEYMYLFTEYDVVGEGGGVIITDNLHDIRCGKRVESCRTLEDAGIDINKYKPLRCYKTGVFGVPCHFAYFKGDDGVIVAYLPVAEQAQQRNVNVFSALGTTFIFSVAMFFLVPFLLHLLNNLNKKKSDSDGTGSGLADDELNQFDDGGLDDTGDSDTGDSYESYDSYDTYEEQEIVLPKEEELPVEEDEGTTEAATQEDIPEGDAQEPVSESSETDIADYVSKMQELKRAAKQMGEEKLFKMADYLEKCGKAVLAGSKDADKFMEAIETKTPIAINYYASCVRQQDSSETPDAQEMPDVQEPEQEPVQELPEVTESPVAQEPEITTKPDVPPSEIFATLEALYDGASSADKTAVDSCIETLDKINLPRKLNAVFPELYAAAAQNDYETIKTIIDSLRTGKSAS